ncbi:MAG: PilZ domain-containing protein [Treponema sp.]|nr:PilZ domain-containing protein [Treponema sp.]
MDGSGSPLLARAQLNIFLVIALIVAVFATLTIIYLVYKAIHNYLNSPQYLEKQRRRPTTAKDISAIAKQCALTKVEHVMLTKLCKANPSVNVKYMLLDLTMLEQYMRDEFLELKEKGDENGKTALFSMREKIRHAYAPPETVTSSRKISVGATLTYTAAQGVHYKLTVAEKQMDSITLDIPRAMSERGEKPPTLSKITFVFEQANSTFYLMDTRVVRYQLGKQRQEQMIVMHSDQISPLQKRQNDRIEMQQECKFASVALIKNDDNTSTYKPSNSMHNGTLLDVSTGGCRLLVNIPIKADQLIYVQGHFNNRDDDSAIGTILRTTRRQDDGKFLLHIKFVDISQATMNRILATTCGYD